MVVMAIMGKSSLVLCSYWKLYVVTQQKFLNSFQGIIVKVRSMAFQFEDVLSRKRHATFNGPDSTDMKKGDFNGYLPVKAPRQLKCDIIPLEQKVYEALGLRINFLKDVASDGLLCHIGLKGLLIKLLESAYYGIEKESLKGELSKELLKKVAFDDVNVINDLMRRSKLAAVQHLEPIDFIKRFVKDEFKYNPTLSKDAQQEDNALPDGIGVFDFADYESDEPNEHTEVTRFFHGTDLHSAVDIMNNGIELDYGRHKHDFSNGGGFYLTASFKHAKAWARSQTRKPAVLELKIPKALFEKAHILPLEVSTEEGRSAWDRIVRENRSGRPSEKLEQELEMYDCITGPISVPRYSGSDERVPEYNSHQLCVVNQGFADEIVHSSEYALYTEHEKQL